MSASSSCEGPPNSGGELAASLGFVRLRPASSSIALARAGQQTREPCSEDRLAPAMKPAGQPPSLAEAIARAQLAYVRLDVSCGHRRQAALAAHSRRTAAGLHTGASHALCRCRSASRRPVGGSRSCSCSSPGWWRPSASTRQR